ncbi:LytR C-terminal domain-containing protein [Actinoplanes sp. NBC_00393]|uniref:LytR C-terminal domain-containing protein n=1 Tax=Actinoplanes sp. NBC_00393 TaxID=2975953 RepID=UPI002E1C5867
MRAFSVVSLLVVTAIVAVVVAMVRDSQADAATGDCPPGVPKVDLTLPNDPALVKIRVLNGSKAKGTAERVTEEFKNRGFQVQPPAKSKNKLTRVAVIHYGPKAVGAAQWIRAHFLGAAEPQFSAARADDVIDVVIGDQYQQLATRTEVNQSLAQLSGPALPPGTCSA